MAGEIDAVAVTHEGIGTPVLAWLCAKYGVTLYRLAIDWREIPAAEALAGGGESSLAAEARVVRFTDAGRGRLRVARALARESAAGRFYAHSHEFDGKVSKYRLTSDGWQFVEDVAVQR